MSDSKEQDYLNEIYEMLNRPTSPGLQKPPPENPPKRKKRRRRSFPWLGIFAVVLTGALLFAIGRYRRDLNNPPVVAESVPASITAQDGDTLTIAAAGDINITEEILRSAQQSDGAYDFSEMLLGMVPSLSGADLTVADLEVNCLGAPYDPAQYNAPEGLLSALAESGVDLVQTANTVSIYNGMSGLHSTLAAVRNAGLIPVGTFATEQEAKEAKGFTLVEVKGFRVAFVAFTKGVGNLRIPDGAEYSMNLLYHDYNTTYQDVNTDGIREVLSQVQSEKPDITIALLHWGSEYNSTVSESQEEIRDLMLEGGVDVILGTHSHLVGPLEMTDSPDGRMLTAYSLGNLLSTSEESGANQGIVLQLQFTKTADGVTLTDYSYDPLYLAGEDETASGKMEIWNTADQVALYESSYVGRVSDEIYESLKGALEEVEASVQARDDAE